MKKLLIGVVLLLSFIPLTLHFGVGFIVFAFAGLAPADSGVGIVFFMFALFVCSSLFVTWQLIRWIQDKSVVNKILIIFLLIINLVSITIPISGFGEEPQSILEVFRDTTGL